MTRVRLEINPKYRLSNGNYILLLDGKLREIQNVYVDFHCSSHEEAKRQIDTIPEGMISFYEVKIDVYNGCTSTWRRFDV